MTCLNPYVVSIGLAFGCGRCYFCRMKKAKEWTHRIILESTQHGQNAFITLTYSDENLPANSSLDPRQLQLFLKRLRKSLPDSMQIRFFAVGEYGDTTQRPHYHCALFGYPPCRSPTIRKGQPCLCGPCVGIRTAWSSNGIPLGHISVGTLEPASAGYIAAYATKSMEQSDADKIYPAGRTPPFSRQSNRPGIGAGIADDVASVLLETGFDKIQNLPTHLQHGTDRRPLGRYLRNRIRARVGIPKEVATEYGLNQLKTKMSPLREIALRSPPGTRSNTFREELVKAFDVKRLQILGKKAIYKQRKKL